MNRYREYEWREGPNCAHGYSYKSLLAALDKDRNKSILDAGCGNGIFASRLIKEGFDVYGIDASVTGVEIAARENPGRFFVIDLEKNKLPEELQDKRFDTIISTDVIEHLYDPRKFVMFCKSILAENGGGELIIATPYHGYLKNCAISLFNGWDRHFTALWDGGHIKFWSRKTLTQLLDEFDFDNLSFKGYGRFPLLWKGMIVKAVLAGKAL